MLHALLIREGYVFGISAIHSSSEGVCVTNSLETCVWALARFDQDTSGCRTQHAPSMFISHTLRVCPSGRDTFYRCHAWCQISPPQQRRSFLLLPSLSRCDAAWCRASGATRWGNDGDNTTQLPESAGFEEAAEAGDQFLMVARSLVSDRMMLLIPAWVYVACLVLAAALTRVSSTEASSSTAAVDSLWELALHHSAFSVRRFPVFRFFFALI